MDIKETGWENTKWIYRFQHTGLIVFCEHIHEHCGSVTGGERGAGLLCKWATIVLEQEVTGCCLLGYDNVYKLTEMNLQEHKQH